ncbi:MAG: DUF4911 domain-containing protein [Candidatus Cloacimonadales bacterium]|jgi:hypothetical protein|nr:DUF4911 domain-containing protein [Candidatus Cloacimonadota bacterium]MDD2649698.1 DUF4911 domain-containing protein [Candidatus Cloacimonadota bacterium]MDD3500861.1 DUF4911 domain-containing protein [Candidatus Cloacimonadota bacterium]MDX9976802.1 DUF4911 domain-containing protein [Candidatus Cloacimonadales bacterium]
MKINLLERKKNQDQTNSYYIQTPRKEVIFFGSILESLEGWCNYTTFDKNQSIVLVDVAKDYIDVFERLLEQIEAHVFED